MPIGRLLLIPPDEDVGASRTCLLEYLANRSMGETGAMTLFPFGFYLYLGRDSSTAPQPLSLNVAWMPSSFVFEQVGNVRVVWFGRILRGFLQILRLTR